MLEVPPASGSLGPQLGGHGVFCSAPSRGVLPLRSCCVSALWRLLCPGGPGCWLSLPQAGGRGQGGRSPAQHPAGSEPGREAPPRLEPLTQTLESRGPSRAGCTCRGVGACIQVAGPPTPAKGRRAGRGFRPLCSDASGCPRKEGDRQGSESPHSACPGPQTQWSSPHPPRPAPLLGPGLSGWGGVGVLPSQVPLREPGQGSWTITTRAQGPPASVSLSTALSRAMCHRAPEWSQPSTALRSR